MSRYIDAEWLKDRINTSFYSRIGILIDSAPTIDLVRCKDCKNHEDFPTGISPITCSLSWGGVFENDFCSYGERVMSDTELREFCSQMIGKFKLLSDLQREMQYETIDTKFTEWELKKLIFALDVLRAIAEERSE